MNEQFIMRAGDTFVAEECGCSFTTESGPSDEGMVRQAPQCCCGHQMVKQGTSMMGNTGTVSSDTVSDSMTSDMPRAMPG